MQNIKIYANFHIFCGHLGFLGYTNTLKTLKSTKKKFVGVTSYISNPFCKNFMNFHPFRSIFIELRAARHAFRPTVRR
jgi:hypothetical protein